MRQPQPARSGFTLIELMVVVAVTAVLLALAAPAFTGFMAKKRVEGVVSELVNDLQYARSEAVQRNTLVQITLGEGCYVIHALPTTATTASGATSCVQAEGTGSTIGAGETELKTVKISAGGSTALAPTSGNIVFDPVRGMATFSGGGSSVTLTATSSAGAWDLRAILSSVGRVSTCSPAGTGNVVGYATCS